MIMKKINIPNITDIMLAAVGSILCGFGVGLNNGANMGFDGIGVMYDGVRNVLGLNSSQLGFASLIVNLIIIIFLFFAARKYISLGTIIYMAGYSAFTDIGSYTYSLIFHEPTIPIRIIIALIGCAMLYLGLGIYVAIDIGVDSFTGLVLLLRDKTHFELKYVKIAFDISMIVLGVLLGGQFGFITIVAAFLGGPSIQFTADKIQKLYFKRKIKKYKKDS